MSVSVAYVQATTGSRDWFSVKKRENIITKLRVIDWPLWRESTGDQWIAWQRVGSTVDQWIPLTKWQ